MSENGRFIIHVGPPKTATTSLQFFFQQLDIEEFVYGGIIQPRKKNTKSFCSQTYMDVVNGSFENQRYIKNVIETSLKSNKSFLMSEELFLVEEPPMLSWRKKIQRLAKYFENYDITIIFTVREPKNAIISYYHEIYDGLDNKFKEDFGSFLMSEYSKIYKYESLHKYLKKIFSDVIFLDFQKLVTDNYRINDFKLENCQDRKIILNSENVSVKKNDSYVMRSTIRKKISPIIKVFSNHAGLQKFRGKGYGQRILALIPDVRFGSKTLNINFDDFDYSEFDVEYHSIKHKFENK